MRYLVITGATGFLGSHLLKTLLEKTDYGIIVLKRLSSKTNRIDDYITHKRVILFDIDGPRFTLSDIFSGYNIEMIIHTATEYGRNGISPSDILKTNLIFPLTLIEEGIRHNVKLFVNTDSYFNKPNQSYKTLLDYSLSKKSLNIWLEYLSNKMKIVNLRLEHIFGDNDNPDKFIEYVIQSVAIKEVESLSLTYGQQKRDFIFVDDVCNAYLTIINDYEKHYFKYITTEVGTGNAVSIYDFVKYVKEYAKSKTVLAFGRIPYREDEIMCSRADNSTLLDWGWNYKYNYKAGIEKIINTYRGYNEK